jgi:hypothetical protein
MKSNLFFDKGSIWECKFGDRHQVVVVAKGHKQVTAMMLDGSSKEQLKHWKFALFYTQIGNLI